MYAFVVKRKKCISTQGGNIIRGTNQGENYTQRTQEEETLFGRISENNRNQKTRLEGGPFYVRTTEVIPQQRKIFPGKTKQRVLPSIRKHFWRNSTTFFRRPLWLPDLTKRPFGGQRKTLLFLHTSIFPL